MKFNVEITPGSAFFGEVDDLADIETYAARFFPDGLPSEYVTAIHAKYGTPQVRSQSKLDFQGWLTDVDTAITNTETDLPAPSTVNLATLTAIVNELNAARRRDNRIMKAIRYIAKLLIRQNGTLLR